MLDVTDPTFGAVGDGVTDDTAAIQSALDVATGETVYLPGGRAYALSNALVVRSGVTVLARGAYLFGLTPRTLLRNFDAAVDSFPAYSGNSDITLIGGTFDIRGQLCVAGSGEVHQGIAFTHARNIHIENVAIRNIPWAHALEFNAIDGGLARNCRAEGFFDTTPDNSRKQAEAFQIDMAHEGSTSLGPWDDTPSRNITIEGCYAGPSAELGTWGVLVGSHTGKGLGVYYDGVKILNNRAPDGTLSYGVHGECWRDPVITGNTLIGTSGTSIFMDTCVGGVIQGNVIRNAGSNGINISRGNGTVVTGNSINNPVNNAVYFDASNNDAVIGNYCYSGGIFVKSNCTGVLVADNKLV